MELETLCFALDLLLEMDSLIFRLFNLWIFNARAAKAGSLLIRNVKLQLCWCFNIFSMGK